MDHSLNREYLEKRYSDAKKHITITELEAVHSRNLEYLAKCCSDAKKQAAKANLNYHESEVKVKAYQEENRRLENNLSDLWLHSNQTANHADSLVQDNEKLRGENEYLKSQNEYLKTNGAGVNLSSPVPISGRVIKPKKYLSEKRKLEQAGFLEFEVLLSPPPKTSQHGRHRSTEYECFKRQCRSFNQTKLRGSTKLNFSK